MILTYTPERKRFEVMSKFSEKDIIKSAFGRGSWDPDRKIWHTDDPNKAAVLFDAADDIARPMLADIAAGRRAADEASRAVDAEIDIPVPDGMAYRPFQKAGVSFICSHIDTLLADEMGLGKTVQVCGAINHLRVRSILIVCPANAKNVWKDHLKAWSTHEMSVGVAYGNDWPDTDVVIINKDIIERHEARMREKTWDLYVIDEAHYFRNTTAKMTRVALGWNPTDRQIAAMKDPEMKRRIAPVPCKRRVFLTGTPLVNRPKELYTLLHALDPSRWNSFFDYGKRYCGGTQKTIYIKGGHGMSRLVWDFDGASNCEELQRLLRETLMLRRLKSQVLKELPPKTISIVTLDPDDVMSAAIKAEREAWAQVAPGFDKVLTQAELDLAEVDEEEDPNAFLTAFNHVQNIYRVAFEQMSDIRHKTALAKVPSVVNYVSEMLETQAKVAVWIYHQDVGKRLFEAFKQLSFAPVMILGGDSDLHRRKAQEYFQNDPNCRVFIGSIQAAGTAITLTACDKVVFAERDWVPGNERQAMDRHHRMGQVNPVNVYMLNWTGTLDDHLTAVINQKQDIADRILDRDCSLKINRDAPRKRTLPTYPEEKRKAMLHACRILTALDPDYVAFKNDVGWNGCDARIGHYLASLDDLTDRQAVLALRILKKYHFQIGEQLMTTLYGADWRK